MADTGSGEGPPTPSSGTSEVKRASLDGNEDLTTQLARVRAEKEALEGQYRNLVTKLTTMRQTLGNKMQQDADELDRRAAQIQELSEACGLLRTELEESQGENSQLSSDAQHAQAQLQEALDETEQLRSSSETAELQTSQYRTEAEGARQSVDYLTRELQQAQAKANQAEVEADKQRSAAENLQNVLHEFQTAKDQEITAATDDLREQLQGSLRMLNEYKQRALSAEVCLSGDQLLDPSDECCVAVISPRRIHQLGAQ